MNRRIYTIILTIVTIFVCMGALAYHTGRAISGCAACISEDYDFNFDFNGSTLKEWAKESAELSGNAIEADFDEKGYASIDLKGSVSDVTIAEGEGYSFHFKGDEVLKPEVSVKNNTLVVTQKRVRTNSTNNIYSEITITVPKDALKRIEIDSAVGDVRLDDLSCESIDAVMAVGTIYAENVDCSGKAEIEANVGEIRLTNSSFGDVDLISKVGEIYVKNCRFEDADFDSNIGNVTITGIDPDDYNFDVDCSLGEFRYNGRSYGKREKINNFGARYKLRVNSDIGNVEIKTK